MPQVAPDPNAFGGDMVADVAEIPYDPYHMAWRPPHFPPDIRGLMIVRPVHPLLQQLCAYWDERRAGRAMPARADIDPVDFAYALGNVILVDVLHAPMRFRIRLHGTTLATEAGYELTGKMLDELPITEFRALATQSFTATATSGLPFHSSRDRVLDGRRRAYETVMLPMSDDGTTVNMLLVALFYGR